MLTEGFESKLVRVPLIYEYRYNFDNVVSLDRYCS